MKLLLIDYGSGNLTSAAKAAQKVMPRAMSCEVSAELAKIKAADYIILPGVGAFHHCLQGIKQHDGLYEAILNHIHQKKRPFLGICVGMQLLADRGYEFGEHQGFGCIAGEVRSLKKDKNLPVPNIGWHPCQMEQAHFLHQGLPDASWFYFVHSYHFMVKHIKDKALGFDYGRKITAAIAHENIYGTQFHPEKSQANGLKLLENFLNWKP